MPAALAMEVLEIDKPRYFDLLGGNAEQFTFDELIRWLLISSVAVGKENVYQDAITKYLPL
jgi:predicted XRE-type DNA-binding protein